MSQPENLRDNERTISQLVADASHDISGIVKSEIALAKAEVSKGAKVMGKGAGLLVGAAVLAVFGLIYLFHTPRTSSRSGCRCGPDISSSRCCCSSSPPSSACSARTL